jgi:hypothetical protein
MAVVLKKALLKFIMVILSAWAIHYKISWHAAKNSQYTNSRSKTGSIKYFADAWYHYGLKAWYENDLKLAAGYFC